MDIASFRRTIPVLAEYAYFQTSGIAPSPEPVLDEAARWLRIQNEGPALAEVGKWIRAMRERVRQQVASLVGATPDEIVFTANATVGINIVACGIDWRPGDNVVLSDQEHPANLLTWYNIARRHEVDLRFLQLDSVEWDREMLLARLANLLDDRTRIVSVSHVSRWSGLCLPAEDIVTLSHSRGVPVLFDAAQAVGAIPVDVRSMVCDFYSFCGHKYLLGPKGTGGLYIAPDRLDWLEPSWLGAGSAESSDGAGNMTLLDSARRFEYGTRDIGSVAGWGKALAMLNAVGFESIYSTIRARAEQVRSSLGAIPGLAVETPGSQGCYAGIVTFCLDRPRARELIEVLLASDRVIVSIIDDSRVRVSVHFFNTEQEIDRLARGVDRFQKAG